MTTTTAEQEILPAGQPLADQGAAPAALPPGIAPPLMVSDVLHSPERDHPERYPPGRSRSVGKPRGSNRSVRV